MKAPPGNRPRDEKQYAVDNFEAKNKLPQIARIDDGLQPVRQRARLHPRQVLSGPRIGHPHHHRRICFSVLHNLPRIQLRIAASLHEKMIVSTSSRSQEQENCREMGPPATSSLRTTGNGTFPGNPLQAHFGVSAAK
jgi:hypothetical protein